MSAIPRLYLLVLTSISGLNLASAQLLVENTFPNNHPDSLVQNILKSYGITISNVTFNGSPGIPTTGGVDAIGYFDGSTSNIGMDYGIILNTGDINDAPGPNITGTDGFDNLSPGDPDLDLLLGNPTFNAAVLEFDFVTMGSEAYFKYVFGSEEYNEMVCSMFNDGFGFFVSGPGISGPFSDSAINIALIPNSMAVVGINTVNNGLIGSSGNTGGCGGSGDPGLLNSTYFVDNENLGQQSVQYDGFTEPLLASIATIPGQTYHLKIVVADALDAIYDSGVFLEGGSFGSPYIGTLKFINDSILPDTCGITATGAISVNIMGGILPHTFFWSNGDTTQNLSNLDSGTYSLVVKDALGDSILYSAFVNEVDFEVNFGYTSTHCDSSLGSITAILQGGNAPFTYFWNDLSMQTNSTATGLQSGIYSVNVIATGGCSVTDSGTVIGNSLLVQTIDTNISCNGLTDGFSTAVANSGASPYIYNWSDLLAQTSVVASGLSAGSYTVTVTDNLGCSGFENATITEPPIFIIDTAIITNVSCYNTLDGEVTIIPSGGIPPYFYDWSACGGQTLSDSIATGLPGGNCCVSVYDNNGCFDFSCYIVFGPGPIYIIATSFPSNSYDSTGSIDMTVDGGVSPYQYLWSNGDTTQDLNGISVGVYFVTIMDSLGCSYQDSVVVEQANSVVHWKENNLLDISIYPNPSSNNCTLAITLLAPGNLTYVGHNLLGEVVLQGEENSLPTGTSEVQIDTDKLIRGVFLLEVSVGDARVVKKMLVQ